MIWLLMWGSAGVAIGLFYVASVWDLRRQYHHYHRGFCTGYYEGGRVLVDIMLEEDIVNPEEAKMLHAAILKRKEQRMSDPSNDMD